jgi:hypothetical protein
MYIKWDEDEKARILAEARRLLKEQPRLSKEETLRKAQLILGEDRQRRISSIATPAFDWFHTGLLAAESAPPAPEPEPEAPPEPALDPDILSRVLDIVLGIDRKFETRRFEERLADVEKQVRRIHRILDGGFALVPAESLVRPEPEQAVAAPATNGATARKPNVVVISVPSGNTQGGIRKGTSGFVAKLDFWETPKRQVNFDAYDYIVATKFTPPEWIAAARSYIPNGKLRISTGNSEQISRFIRTLPEIPLK